MRNRANTNNDIHASTTRPQLPLRASPLAPFHIQPGRLRLPRPHLRRCLFRLHPLRRPSLFGIFLLCVFLLILGVLSAPLYILDRKELLLAHESFYNFARQGSIPPLS